MKKGVKVYGSSSMGALRASELDEFGMVGVGRIYECYRSGPHRDRRRGRRHLSTP